MAGSIEGIIPSTILSAIPDRNPEPPDPLKLWRRRTQRANASATIGRSPIMFQTHLDTGSVRHSYINEDLAAALRLPRTQLEHPANVTLPDGTPMEFHSVCMAVPLHIYHHDSVVYANLLPLPNCPVDIIVGLDTLPPQTIGNILQEIFDEQDQSAMLASMVSDDHSDMPDEDDLQSFPEMSSVSSDDEVELPTCVATPELAAVVSEYPDLFPKRLRREEALVSKMRVEYEPLSESKRPKSRNGPVRLQPRLYNREIDRQLDIMLADEVIETTNAAEYSQVLLVRKADGSLRFCVDYRQVNERTVPQRWPVPNIHELIRNLQGNTVFGTLDLSQGYWQVALDREEDREKTAFITSRGMYRFRRVPFGLRNAPAHFQKVMADEVLRGLAPHICMVYVDDIIVFGKTMAEFVANLRTVFDRLRKHRISLKAAKCKLGLKEVEYCGHIVNGAGMRMSDGRKEAFRAIPLPPTITRLRSFLGVGNYFHPFIKNFATLAAPLFQLTAGNQKKQAPVQWTKEGEDAFFALRNAVADTPMLFHLVEDPNCKVHVFTDASATALGGMIAQEVDGNLRPICFLSRKFTASQRNYSTTDREMLAVWYVLKKARVLLAGRHFIVHCDHKALESLKESQSQRVERMRLGLQEFDYEVAYIRGEENIAADAMSRLDEGPMECLASIIAAEPQERGETTKAARWRILKNYHGGMFAHNGRDAMLAQLALDGYDWKGMREDISTFIAACPSCQLRKTPAALRGTTFSLDTNQPNGRWDADTIGPLKPDLLGYQFVLVVVDVYTRRVHLRALQSTKGKECSLHLEQLFCDFGCPAMFHSDNASQFVNQEVKELLAKWGVQEDHTASHNSLDNAIAERAILEVREKLGASIREMDPDSWSSQIPLTQWNLNQRPIPVLGGVSAADLTFGRLNSLGAPQVRARQMELQDAVMLHRNAEHLNKETARLESNRERDNKARERAASVLQPGTRVLVQNFERRKASTTHDLFCNPSTVVAVRGNKVDVTNEVTGRTTTQFIGHLKPTNSPTEDNITNSPSEETLTNDVKGSDQPIHLITRIVNHEPKSSRSLADFRKVEVEAAVGAKRRWFPLTTPGLASLDAVKRYARGSADFTKILESMK